MILVDPFFKEADDLSDQTRGFTSARVLFGTVVQTRDTPGYESLGDFSVNVTADGAVYTDVPIGNPNSGSPRPLAASVGNTVMLLQFIDGPVICLGRVNV